MVFSAQYHVASILLQHESRPFILADWWWHVLFNLLSLTPPTHLSHRARPRPSALASSIQTAIESGVELVESQIAGCTESGATDCTARPFYISHEHKALICEHVDGYRETASSTYAIRGVSGGERWVSVSRWQPAVMNVNDAVETPTQPRASTCDDETLFER